MKREKAAKLAKNLEKKEEILEIIPEMIAAIKTNKNENIRVENIRALSKFGELAEDAVQALIQTIKSDNSKEVRKWSIIALGKIGPKAKPAINTLLETLNKAKSPIIRKNVILSLGKIVDNNKRVFEALKKFKEENNGWWVNPIIDPIIEEISP